MSSNEPSRPCHFCERIRNASRLADRLVCEDEFFHVSPQANDDGPTLLGDLILQTKRHVPDLGELSQAEAAALGPLIARLSRALKECTGASWTYCFAFLEGYRHVHVSILSRYPGLPKEFVRLDLGKWPEAPRGSPERVAELCRRLGDALSCHPTRVGPSA